MRATQKERERLFSPDKFANNSSFVGQICIIYGAASVTLSLSLSEHKASGGAMSNNRQEAARAEKKRYRVTD
jgi:hypothetical protein